MIMPNMSMKKNEMPAQEPQVRNKNFLEVALGYTPEDIDELLEAGYSTDEIEEELYDMAPWR